MTGGSMGVAVSGMKAQANRLKFLADNAARASVTAGKRRDLSFASVVTGRNSPGGVTTHARHFISEQGSVIGTDSATDMAINGGGFFIVSAGEGSGSSERFFYTRDGSAVINKNGVLQSPAGFIYRGWTVDENGEPETADTGSLTQLVPINLSNVTGSVKATTSATQTLNLQPNATQDADFSSNINIVDSLGSEHVLKLNWQQTGVNQWDLSIADISEGNPPGLVGTVTQGGAAYSNIPVTFNGDGTPASFNGGAGMPSIDITWAGGANSSTISLNLGTVDKNNGVTQLAGTISGVKNTVTDGQVLGINTGFTISEDGVVTAQFSNGLVKKLYKLPLGTFINPDGLVEQTGNVYNASGESGSCVLSSAGSGSAGTITGNSLESSTVDLAGVVTDMIETQTAHSINAKVVETYKNVFGTLERL